MKNSAGEMAINICDDEIFMSYQKFVSCIP